MADQDPQNESLELKLSLLSGADSTALQQFASSMQTMGNFFKTFDASSFIKEANSLRNLVKSMQDDTQRLIQGYQDIQSGGTASFSSTPGVSAPPKLILPHTYTPSPPPGPPPPPPPPGIVDWQNQKQIVPMTNPTPGVSTPPPPNQNTPWNDQLKDLRRKVEDVPSLPKFGHLTIEDYLKYTSGAMEGLANKAADANNSIVPAGLENSLGSAAVLAQKGALVSTYGVGVIRAMQSIGTMASKYSVNPFDMSMAGAQLGYGRNTGDAMGFLPFANPLGAASTAEGARQTADIYKMAFQPGINISQAQQIEGAATGAGFGGSMGGNITDNLLAPLFQKFGADPNAIMQAFGPGLRTGITSISNLAGTLNELGTAAQAAHMTLSDTIATAAQAGQANMALGGSPLVGTQTALQFMNYTGLPGAVATQALQNPFVQAMLASQNGVLPNLIGTLPASTQVAGISTAVNDLYNQILPGFKNKNTPIVIDGKVVGTNVDSATAQAQGQVAGMLGLDPSEVQRLVATNGFTQNSASAVQLLQQKITQMNQTANPNASQIASLQKQIRTNINSGGNYFDNVVPGDEAKIKRLVAQDNSDSSYAYTHNSKGQYSPDFLSQFYKTYQQIDPFQSHSADTQQWKKNVLDQKTPLARLNAAKSLIQNRASSLLGNNNQSNATIQIVLNKDAKKIFTANPTSVSLNVNAGNQTSTDAWSGASTPYNLGYGPGDITDSTPAGS